MPPEGDSGLDNGGSRGSYGVPTRVGSWSSKGIAGVGSSYSVVSHGCYSWLSKYIVLNMNWVGDCEGYIDWGWYRVGLSNSVRLGYAIGLWHVLVLDGGDFLCFVHWFWHSYIVDPFSNLKFRSYFGDLRSMRDDWAAKSLNWDALDQEFGGRSFTSWDRGGDVEVDVGVSEGWCYSGCHGSGVRGNGQWGGGTEDREGINVD